VNVGDAIVAFKSNAVCWAEDMGLAVSLVSSAFVRPTIAFVIPPTVPVKVGEAIVAFVPIRLVMVVEKLGSSPKAVANSFRVSSVEADPLIKFAISVLTKAVDANWVLLVDAIAVGAKGVPVKVGDAKSAFKPNAVVVAVDTGLLASLVLSTLAVAVVIVSSCV
jgi:hypothetical protein